jgi:hypothetical protein
LKSITGNHVACLEERKDSKVIGLSVVGLIGY